MIRVIPVQVDLLTSFDLRGKTFRVTLELSIYHHETFCDFKSTVSPTQKLKAIFKKILEIVGDIGIILNDFGSLIHLGRKS